MARQLKKGRSGLTGFFVCDMFDYREVLSNGGESMKCTSLMELFSAVDVSCDKVKSPAAHAVRDFIREQCVLGTLKPTESVKLSEADFVRKARFLAKAMGAENVPPDGCVMLKEHVAYKSFAEVLEKMRPHLERMPSVDFHLTDDWRFGLVFFSSGMSSEVVEAKLVKPRLIGLCQTVLFTNERLIHFLLLRPEECSPFWLGLHALQTFAVEGRKRQERVLESEQIVEHFRRVLGGGAVDRERLAWEGESYQLIFSLLNQHLGGMLVPIVESYAVTSVDTLKGLVDFVLAECVRAHGEPLSAAERELRELMVRSVVLTRKVSADRLADLLGVVAG